MAINIPRTLESHRQKYPDYTQDLSDDQLIRRLMRAHPDEDWSNYTQPKVEARARAEKLAEPQDAPDSPTGIKKLLLWNANDALADDYDWAKRAYNNSLAGNAYKMMYGKSKYAVEEFDDPWWIDVAGFFLGMTNPIEAGLFIGSGGAGSVAAKAASKKFFFETAKQGLRNASSKKLKDKVAASYMMKKSTAEGAFGLGLFSAASGTIQRYGEQSVEKNTINPETGQPYREDFDHSEIFTGVGSDFIHGAALGALGGIVKAPMARKFATASKKASKLKSEGIRVPSALAAKKILNSPVGQVMAEANAFTAGQKMEEAIANGEMPNIDDWWGMTFTNTGIIGGMRAGTKVYRTAIKGDFSGDVDRYYAARKKLFKDTYGDRIPYKEWKRGKNVEENKKEIESLENIQETLGENTPKEVIDKLAELEAESYFSGQEKSIVKSKIRKLDKLIDKATEEGPKAELNLERLTKAERGEFGKLSNELNSWALGFYDTLKKAKAGETDFDLAREVFKGSISKNPSKTQDSQIRNIVDSRILRHEKVSDLWNDAIKDPIGSAKKVTEEVPTTKERLAPKSEFQIVDDLVTKLSALKKVGPDVIRKTKEYEVAIITKDSPLLSKEKLQKAINAELEKQPGTPQSELSKVLSEINIETIKESPVFNKKIGKETKISDYIEKSELSNENKSMLYKGISEFMQGRKSSNQPKNYKLLTDYAKWLQDKGKKVSEASQDLTELYINEMQKEGLFRKQSERNALNNSLSAFYGTGGTGIQKITTGFSYKYMGEKGVNPRVSTTEGRMGALAGQEKIALVAPEEYSQVKSAKQKLIDTGESLQGSGKQKVSPEVYDTATEMMYEFGSRGADTLKRLYIENIDWKNGVIREWSTGFGQKGLEARRDVPLKKVIPELWEKLVKIKGDREKGNLFKDLNGKNLSNETINIINEAIMPEGVNLRGKKGKLTVQDYRRMAETDAGTISSQIKDFVDKYLIGHTKTTMAERYNIQDVNKLWKQFREGRIKEALIGKQRALKGGRPEGETIFKGKDVDAARAKFIKDVAKKNKLTGKQLREAGLDEKVMGEFAEGEIKLKRGEWQPADFYHENLHRLKAFSKATGNKKLLKLIEGGEKLGRNTKEFKEWKKKNPNRDMEEFLGDIVGGKTSRIQFTKGMLPKINQFIKQLVSKMKVAFGVGNFKDISRVLAGKVGKGFATEGVKFKKGTKQRLFEETETVRNLGLEREQAESTRKSVLRQFNKMVKQSEMLGTDAKSTTAKGAIKRFIQEYMGIEDFPGFEKSGKYKELISKQIENSPREYYEKLKQFEKGLEFMNPSKVKRISDKGKWFKERGTIEAIRTTKNITEATQRSLLKDSFGVKDGDIYNASLKQLKNYKEILHTINEKELRNPSWVDEQIANNIMERSGDSKYKSLYSKFKKTEVAKIILPLYKIAEASGLKPLSNMLKEHYSIESGHLGVTYDLLNHHMIKGGWKSSIDNNGNKLKAGKEITISGIGKKGWEKMRDNLWTMDHKGERIIDSMNFLKNNPELFTGKDGRKWRKEIRGGEAFLRKAIKKEFFELKNKDGTLKGGNLKKYINYSTKEGRAVERHIETMKYIEDMVDLMLRKNLNEAQYEKFMKQGNIKWIRDGIFVTRQSSSEFIKLLNLESKPIKDIIDKAAIVEAQKLAKEHFNTENPTNKQLGEVMPQARDLALESLHDGANFSIDKISSKSLIKRGLFIPEFVVGENGKLIRTRETTFDSTTGKYAIGMSKFLATMEVFPEFAKIKGFRKSGAKKLLGELKLRNKDSADWFKEGFNKRIGVAEANPFRVLTGKIQMGANILAKVGLSGPTSGFKNIITGTAGTLYANKLSDMGRAFAGILRGESAETIKTGHKSAGMGHYKEGQVTEFFDKYAFRFGGMRITEGFNRNLAILSSKYDQRRMIQNTKDFKKGTKEYEGAYERLTDFYELRPDQVKLVQKHGFEINNVLKENFKSNREFLIEKRNLEVSIQKMNTMAHVKTQGSTAEIFMPKFASGKYFNPFLLYKKMAYAATINTSENIMRAKRSGNYMKIINGTLGTYFGGAALAGVYWHVLGQPMPKENDPVWKKIQTTMWKGEFLGLLSEFFNPHGPSLNDSFTPAIHNNASAFIAAAMDIYEGKKYVFGTGQAVETYLRKSHNLYNTVKKVIERRSNPYNRDMLRFRALYKDFETDILEETSGVFEANELSKYRIDLRNAWNLGTDEEFVKTYVVLREAIIADYMQSGWDDTPREGVAKRILSHSQAEKAADTKLKNMITNLNPNLAFLTEKQEAKTKLKKISYRDWLAGRTSKNPEGTEEGKALERRLLELEREYQDRLKSLKGGVFQYHLRKLNLKKMAKKSTF
jgi:hypothetical protein